jgi:hypothetical protein
LPFGIHANLGLKLDDGNGGSFTNSKTIGGVWGLGITKLGKCFMNQFCHLLKML